MYQMSSRGSSKSGSLNKWDGLPLEKQLRFEDELASARKAARDFQRGRGSEAALHWRPTQLPSELLAKHEVIGFFVPKALWDEPETLETLLQNATNAKPIVLCLPKIDSETNTITFYEIRDPAKDLVMNTKFQILEPKAAPRRKRRPTLLMIPCLMADLTGRRIGRGGGFYDRYLATHPEVCDRVGVLHSTSVIERGIPSHWMKDHDQKLTALITDQSYQNVLAPKKE